MSESSMLEEEMNLMCHVIMNDSCWLDTFQTSLLNGDRARKEFVTPQLVRLDLPDSNDPVAPITAVDIEDVHENPSIQHSSNYEVKMSEENQRNPGFWSKDLGISSKKPNCADSRTITAPMSIVSQLPAPEFVDGTNSIVASESMRMISTVALMYNMSPAGEHQLQAQEKL
jgi:hypothetical protein